MTLTLAMLRCPDNAAPETRMVAGGDYSIGRGPENDWVLTDPERGLSKRHCVLAYRAGGWQVADFSTNGTFLNRESEPIGRGQSRDLRSGDRLSFGAYEIEIQIDEAGSAFADAPRAAATSDPFAVARPAPAADMFALDPFARPPRHGEVAPATRNPFLDEGGVASGLGPAPVTLPADFDPLAPDTAEPEFRGPTQPDHTPSIEDAFAPPMARSVLPDDWDRELNALGAVVAPAPIQEPSDFQPMPSPAAPPAPAWTEQPAPVLAPPNTRSVPVARPAPIASPDPVTEPVTATAPPVATAAPPAAAPVARAPDALLAAFLRGAGLPDRHPADPEAAMEALGAAFRAVVVGLRQAMIARSAVKGEFRIEQTMIRSRGNNPLKFSADDDDALSALLGVGRRTDMGPVEAVSDALRDIRLHELATVSAMQSAVRVLLTQFDPGPLCQTAEHGGLALMAMQRKAHAWDAFEQLHGRITQALADDFDSVFGKAFARAYERALAEISTREPNP